MSKEVDILPPFAVCGFCPASQIYICMQLTMKRLLQLCSSDIKNITSKCVLNELKSS